MSEEEKRPLDNIFWDNDCKYWYMYDETYYEIIKLIYRLIKELEQEKEKREIAEENEKVLSLDLGDALKELGLPEDTIIADELVLEINNRYISKDKIKAKIEELQCDEDNYENYAIRRAYKELLEE